MIEYLSHSHYILPTTLFEMAPHLLCIEAVLLCGVVFIGLTVAFPQFEDVGTIAIRATKISSPDRLNNGELIFSDDSDNSDQQVHGLYPDLKFTCNTTLRRLWYIGLGSVTEESANGPSLHFWTSNKDNQYRLVNSSQILRQNSISNQIPLILMNEINPPIEVHNNDVISIVQAQSPLKNTITLRFNGGGPTGLIGTADPNLTGERPADLIFHTQSNSSNYPMLAVETDSPNCTSGFLNLTILESFLAQVFTPTSDEHRLIPSLNFSCSAQVSRWIVGGVTTGSNIDTSSFSISLWRNSISNSLTDGRLQLVQKVSIAEISPIDKPNVYIVTTTSALQVQEGTFIGISQSQSSPLQLFYVRGEVRVNLIYTNTTISSGSTLLRSSANRQQSALPLLRPLSFENVNLRSDCVPAFISNETLFNRALLIDNITYAPETQQQTTNNGAFTMTNTTRSAPGDSDTVKRATETSSSIGINGSVYIFCGDPFDDDGRILSWTFAASRGQVNSELLNIIDSYPQLLILRPLNTSPQRCSNITFNKANRTRIINPPILLETLDMYRVDLDLSYKKGDVLGIFQPPDSLAVLSLAFINSATQVESTAVRVQGNLNLSQISVNASEEKKVITTLPLFTISTTNDDVATNDTDDSDKVSTTEEMKVPPLTTGTEPVVIVNDLPASSNNNLAIIGAAAGVAITVVLLTIIIVVFIVYIARRTIKKKNEVSANEISLSHVETNAYFDDTEENEVDPLSNPTYAVPGTCVNQVQIQRAEEYEVPVTSLTHTSPDQRDMNFYQEVSQPYETPVKSLRNMDLDKPNVYHVLEAPAQDQFSSVTSDVSYFSDNEEFWKPASNPEQLYRQLSTKKYREIARHQIKVTGKLGSGEFGEVCNGVWTKSNKESVEVAVKKLKPNATEGDRVRFLQEAAIMGQFRHPNVVTLMGVVTIGDPVMIVMKYMANSDLLGYLTKQKPKLFEKDSISDWPQILLDFCQHIAAGMDYLHKKGFIHRDLAARNILVAADNTCKISDFGLSRDLEDENYYVSKGGMIPVKWTAPEALNFKKFSSPCDVWSYGIVVYEIWSFGNKPYKKIQNVDVLPKVEEGYRIPPPPGCPREVYRIMIQCWHPEASLRPSFSEILDSLLQPQNELLQWRSEDKAVHPDAATLAAALDAGETLYPDLQSTYLSVYEAASITVK